MIIDAITITALNGTATIRCTTSAPASVVARYGPPGGALAISNASTGYLHTVTISGLTDGTTYQAQLAASYLSETVVSAWMRFTPQASSPEIETDVSSSTIAARALCTETGDAVARKFPAWMAMATQPVIGYAIPTTVNVTYLRPEDPTLLESLALGMAVTYDGVRSPVARIADVPGRVRLEATTSADTLTLLEPDGIAVADDIGCRCWCEDDQETIYTIADITDGVVTLSQAPIRTGAASWVFEIPVITLDRAMPTWSDAILVEDEDELIDGEPGPVLVDGPGVVIRCTSLGRQLIESVARQIDTLAIEDRMQPLSWGITAASVALPWYGYRCDVVAPMESARTIITRSGVTEFEEERSLDLIAVDDPRDWLTLAAPSYYRIGATYLFHNLTLIEETIILQDGDGAMAGTPIPGTVLYVEHDIYGWDVVPPDAYAIVDGTLSFAYATYDGATRIRYAIAATPTVQIATDIVSPLPYLLWNRFDDIGLLLATPRHAAESNLAYRDRLLAAAALISGPEHTLVLGRLAVLLGCVEPVLWDASAPLTITADTVLIPDLPMTATVTSTLTRDPQRPRYYFPHALMSGATIMVGDQRRTLPITHDGEETVTITDAQFTVTAPPVAGSALLLATDGMAWQWVASHATSGYTCSGQTVTLHGLEIPDGPATVRVAATIGVAAGAGPMSYVETSMAEWSARAIISAQYRTQLWRYDGQTLTLLAPEQSGLYPVYAVRGVSVSSFDDPQFRATLLDALGMATTRYRAQIAQLRASMPNVASQSVWGSTVWQESALGIPQPEWVPFPWDEGEVVQ